MSEETAKAGAAKTGGAGDEPSMEDILASIRRILSEEEEAARFIKAHMTKPVDLRKLSAKRSWMNLPTITTS